MKGIRPTAANLAVKDITVARARRKNPEGHHPNLVNN